MRVGNGERDDLSRVLGRYRGGEPRNLIFRDLILGSVARVRADVVSVLDIGCGHGLDGSLELQRSIADAAGRFIGVEPDPDIQPPAHFTEVHRCLLEDAPLAPGSIHVAYSAFVLEHVATPQRFWDRIYDALAPGGVVWGITVDARHPFRLASGLLERLQLKDAYLDLLRGRRGIDRYENYPTHYRTNAPRQIRGQTRRFTRAAFLSLHREGQLDYYVPRSYRWAMRLMERAAMTLRLPGSVLLVRLTK